MNNTFEFLQTQLIGLTITFKPIEKGKDRPVNTMTFLDFHTGQYGLEVNTRISYTVKGATVPTTVTRMLSLFRVMEYIAQAAEQTATPNQDIVVTPTETVTQPAEELEPTEELEPVEEVQEKGKRKRNK